ncbi:MAG: hypothetical protein CVV02_04000 [Firmicutes bacterium HGW-Firmicutes-7]|nr:MAG: hypothetical protein CVV02_04000 [Firmicutes bacterium HGW-Firmicutes-7]
MKYSLKLIRENLDNILNKLRNQKILGGILDVGQSVGCNIYFETIKDVGLKNTTKIQIGGFLKFKGSRYEYKYEDSA